MDYTKPSNWGISGLTPMGESTPVTYSSLQAVLDQEEQRQTSVQQKAQGGLGGFFGNLIDAAGAFVDGASELLSKPTKTLVPVLLGAALFPILGPAGLGASALIAVTATAFEDGTGSDSNFYDDSGFGTEFEPTPYGYEAKLPTLHLQQDTINEFKKRGGQDTSKRR